METLVLGQMSRAGLLLSLLLCFGPETAGTINPVKLKRIVDYVNHYGGVNKQYAFAVSLPHATCRKPLQNVDKYLPRTQLDEMRENMLLTGGLYSPNNGNIVAARPRDVVIQGRKYTEHSEWRLLHGPDSLVAKLKSRTYGQNSCLILFTYNSPCSTKCLSETGRANIVQMTSGAFLNINNNYKAFVFQKIFHYDMDNVSRRDLLKAWHRLRDVTLLRCDNNGCKDCAGEDTPNRPNPCLAGKR